MVAKSLLSLLVYICFLLFAFTFCIQAQNVKGKPSSYFIPGTYIDEKGNLISGDFDPDYTNKNALLVKVRILDTSVKALFNTQDESPDVYPQVYIAGAYYDLSGKAVNGFLKYTLDKDFVWFKADKNANGEKIKTDSCIGFVIGPDSFPVITRVKNGNDPQEGNAKFKKEFALFYDRINDVAIYRSNRSLLGNFSNETFYIKPDSSEYSIYFPNQLTGNEQFEALFQFKNRKANPIFRNRLDNTEVIDLISLLRLDNIYRQDKKMFLDSAWNYLIDSTNALYYAKVTGIADSIVSMKFFDMMDGAIFQGNFIYDINGMKDGTFIYYDANGEVRKRIVYTENEPDTTILYHANGKVHLAFTMKRKTPKYYMVQNENGEQELTSEGTGTDHFYDEGRKRMINYSFKENRMIEAFYTDSTGKDIYQYCGNDNADFNYEIQNLINKEYTYPRKALARNHTGYMLIRCMVEPDGMVSDYDLIRGIDRDCDSTFLKYFSLVKEFKHFSSGKVQGRKVRQEIIIPVCFKAEFLSNRNFYKTGFKKNIGSVPLIYVAPFKTE